MAVSVGVPVGGAVGLKVGDTATSWAVAEGASELGLVVSPDKVASAGLHAPNKQLAARTADITLIKIPPFGGPLGAVTVE